jgi:hypothetical protein
LPHHFPALIITHAILMVAAFFVVLPMGMPFRIHSLPH